MKVLNVFVAILFSVAVPLYSYAGCDRSPPKDFV